ncbi:MAG: PaaI family thioesterase [Pseudomonadota bacterium]
MKDAAYFNNICVGTLPGLLGITFIEVSSGRVCTEMSITPSHLAPNGFLHAGSVVTLADTTCGNGCIANLPEGALSFTTVELKSNHLGTAREGMLTCVATPAHLGRSTHVWDASVASQATGKTIALFRCTQLILYPKKS